MTAAFTTPATVDPARALERVRTRLPQPRPTPRLALVASRALPVIARSLAAGVVALAAEQALRSVARGLAGRATTARPQAAPDAALYMSYTETTVIERFRIRR
jgi:hypothetical protein